MAVLPQPNVTQYYTLPLSLSPFTHAKTCTCKPTPTPRRIRPNKFPVEAGSVGRCVRAERVFVHSSAALCCSPARRFAPLDACSGWSVCFGSGWLLRLWNVSITPLSVLRFLVAVEGRCNSRFSASLPPTRPRFHESLLRSTLHLLCTDLSSVDGVRIVARRAPDGGIARTEMYARIHSTVNGPPNFSLAVYQYFFPGTGGSTTQKGLGRSTDWRNPSSLSPTRSSSTLELILWQNLLPPPSRRRKAQASLSPFRSAPSFPSHTLREKDVIPKNHLTPTFLQIASEKSWRLWSFGLFPSRCSTHRVPFESSIVIVHHLLPPSPSPPSSLLKLPHVMTSCKLKRTEELYTETRFEA